MAATLDENEIVIASQQERVSMLQFALREKGVVGGGHYVPPSSPPPARCAPPSLQANQRTETISDHEHGGVDL